MNLRRSGSVWFAVLMMAVGWASAEVRLAHIFQDNMVLQRGKPAPVWGWAEPGAVVEVAFAGQTKRATARADGYWRATLEPLAASREGRDLVVRIGAETITRRNVLVGEVWLAAGQSNMNHPGPDKDTGVYPHYVSPPAASGKPQIRIMKFGWGAALEPLADIDPTQRGDSPWQVLGENPAPRSMNLSRYFALVVRDGLDVPVGVVHVAVSGTNQAAWMSRETLGSFPGAGKAANAYEQFFAVAEGKLASSTGQIKSWADFERSDAEWRRTRKGRWPVGARALQIFAFPTSLYNTRIHPVAPLAMRGVIWHQGEGGPGGPYGRRLVAMAKQWRELFDQDLVFIWGTLSRSTTSSPPLEPLLSWFYRSNTNVEIRKALELFGDDKNVALVEFYDVGDHETHFGQKAEAGRRMGLAALTTAYGQDHVYAGPRQAKATINGNKALLRFEHVGKGLVYTPSIGGISGVIVKGAQGPYRWAEVKVIDPATVEVSHPEIAEIKTIAYGVAPNPHETIFNSAGLPASPLRVNVGRIPHGAQGPGMVRPAGESRRAATLSVAHVRRDGYVFRLLKRRGSGDATVTVQAYVSGEWDGCEVRLGGKPVETAETTVDGLRFVTFDAPTDGSWIVVAAKGKAEQFTGVNRF